MSNPELLRQNLMKTVTDPEFAARLAKSRAAMNSMIEQLKRDRKPVIGHPLWVYQTPTYKTRYDKAGQFLGSATMFTSGFPGRELAETGELSGYPLPTREPRIWRKVSWVK